MKKVRTKIQNETASGNRKGWTKHVWRVDITKSNGYAFEGAFIDGGKEVELPVGAVIVQKQPRGSVKHPYDIGRCYVLKEDGELYETDDKDYHWTNNFLSFRDHVVLEVEKFNSTNTQVVVEDPRLRAITQIREMMTTYQITVNDIAPEGGDKLELDLPPATVSLQEVKNQSSDVRMERY